jgi:hypothetical protein
LFAALAVLAVLRTAQQSAPEQQAQALFPGVAERLNELGEIAITTRTGTFRARFTDKGWVIPERAAFPADVETVRATSRGVATLETIEARTARAEMHTLLGLMAPDRGGDSVRIVLNDRTGKPMADVLVSRMEQMPDPDARNRFYVRKSAENQSWLARSSLTLRPEIADWLKKDILNLARVRVASATVTPPNGPAYTVSRPTREHADFAIENMPRGRELSYPGAANTVATALVDFAFEDVKPVGEVDFTGAGTLITRTFDGLSLTVRTVERDGAHWARISAEATSADKQSEAAEVNARTGAFAFKLAEYEAGTLTTARDTLLKPVGGGTEVPTAP